MVSTIFSQHLDHCTFILRDFIFQIISKMASAYSTSTLTGSSSDPNKALIVTFEKERLIKKLAYEASKSQNVATALKVSENFPENVRPPQIKFEHFKQIYPIESWDYMINEAVNCPLQEIS